jgi:hypothetical protein
MNLRSSSLSFVLISCALAPNASAQPSVVCTGSVMAQNTIQCSNLTQAKASVPCGITGFHSAGTLCGYSLNPCNFEIGDSLDPDTIQVEWLSTLNGNFCGGAPGSNLCSALMSSIRQCPWFDYPECPDPEVSGICDPNDPFCGTVGLAEAADQGNSAAWPESCRAYAVMPKGWREDPWRPALAFFTVGGHFAPEWFQETTKSGTKFGITEALDTGRFGKGERTMLGEVQVTPLWGNRAGGHLGWQPEKAYKALEEVGLCLNRQGALLASPSWPTNETGHPGVRLFRSLTVCDSDASTGLGLYNGTKMEGAQKTALLPRLRTLARKNRAELVCLTNELASERRAEREASQQ